MGSHQNKACRSAQLGPSAPVPSHSTGGSPSPDILCNYYAAGTYNGQTYWKWVSGNAFVWWYDPSWVISPQLGVVPDIWYWLRLSSNPVGSYVPGGSASGTLYFVDSTH